MAEFSENDYILSLDNYLPDNSNQQISPKDVRDSLINLVDSSHRFLEPHNIKAKNIESAHLRQTRVGELSLSKTYLPYESGRDNSAFGYSALHGNVFGYGNTAAGSYSLSCNLDGDLNVAVGYSSLVGNVDGNGNVAVGVNTLCHNRKGSYNIAIGHGAGYYKDQSDNYQFYLGSHAEASGCCSELNGSGTPLLRGDLLELKLAVGTNELHNYGTLQVSGDASPTLPRVFNLGNSDRPWYSINGVLIFPDPNNIKSKANIIPCIDGLDLGTPNLRWDGFFRDVNIDGDLTVNGNTICGENSGVRLLEGFFKEYIPAPSEFCSPTSGIFTVKTTCEGACDDGDTIYVKNRDECLEISSGTYGQVARYGDEWRPIWVTCCAPPATTTNPPPTTTDQPTTTSPPTSTTSPPTSTTSPPTSTTTTVDPLGACCSRDLPAGLYSCVDNILASQCPAGEPIDTIYVHHPGQACLDVTCVDPTTTTTLTPQTTAEPTTPQPNNP